MNTSADDTPPYQVPHSQESIRLLFRDPHLLIVDKPTLLLSVPGRHPLNHDCLLNRLSHRYPGVSAVHRLDLDTSGVMVIPRHREACRGSRASVRNVESINPTSHVSRVTSPRTPANATCH